jgi:hypothetical protein
MKSSNTRNREISTGTCIIILISVAMLSLIEAVIGRLEDCTDYVIMTRCLGVGAALLWTLFVLEIMNIEGQRR